MAVPKVSAISGVARPSKRVRRMAEVLHGPKMAACIYTMVEDAKAIDGLAAALDRALTDCTTRDGRLDLREVAMHLLKTMRSNQI